MTNNILHAKYPEAPGFKAVGTSEDAAAQIGPRAATLRHRVIEALGKCQLGMTADECAASLGVDILSIRPRFSELLSGGLIADSGQRRPNASRKMAAIWILQ